MTTICNFRCPNATVGQLASNHSARIGWLWGILLPCQTRRLTSGKRCSPTLLHEGAPSRTAQTSRVAAASTSNGGRSSSSGTGVPPQADAWDDDELSMETYDAKQTRSASNGSPSYRDVQLASKPQPRARGRPLPGPSQAQQSADNGSSGGASQRGQTQQQGGEGGGPEAVAQPAPKLQRVSAPITEEKKTVVVRSVVLSKELQERAAQLAPIIPQAPAAPRLSQRMPQLRLAHLNKRRKEQVKAAAKAAAAAAAAGTSIPPSVASPSGSLVLSTQPLPQYGAPPHTSFEPPGPAGPMFPPAAAAASMSRPSLSEFDRLVRDCKDLDGLHTLYVRYAPSLVRQELVAMVNQLAALHNPSHMTVRVWTAVQTLLVELLQRLTPALEALTMQEYVVVLSGVAKLRYVPPNDWIAAVLTQSKIRLYNASPSYLTQMLRALSRVALDPSDVKETAAWDSWMKRYLAAVRKQFEAYRADEMVKTLVAMSELRYRPPPEWMARFSTVLHTKLDVLEAHSLSEAMLAYASLRYQPEVPFLRAYYSAMASRLPLADDRDLATFAQATALLDRLAKQDFMHEFLAEVVEKLPTFAPQHLATLLGAMGRLAATAGPASGPGSAAAAAAGTGSPAAAAAAAAAASRLRPPSPGWAAAVAQHMEGRMPTFNGPSLATAAWGLSMLGFRPSPKFMDDLLSASYGKLHTCGPTDMTTLLTALGNFGYAPPPGREEFWDTWLTEFEKLCARRHYDTRGVCDLLAAMARLPLRRTPHPEFVAGVLRSTRAYSLRNTSPARLAALAGALAVVGVKPDFGFLYNYAQASRSMWSGFSMRDYATLLGALVHIGTPGAADPRWAADFMAMLMCRMDEFDGPGLAAALVALRHLPKPEFEPSPQWLAAAAHRANELLYNPPQMAPQQLAAASPAPHLQGIGFGGRGGQGEARPPLPLMPPSGANAGGTVVMSPEGRLVPVPPMHPLSAEQLAAAAAALAALGYVAEAGEREPLVAASRSLLARNAGLKAAAAAAAGGGSVAANGNGNGSGRGGAGEELGTVTAESGVGAAFERANAAAAAVAGRGLVAPLLSAEAEAALEEAVELLLGRGAGAGAGPREGVPVEVGSALGLPVGASRRRVQSAKTGGGR